MTTVADVLAHTLQTAGIEIVFGLPGGENVEILDDLRRHDIQFILVRNESSAVFMADVAARLTGKPGVCLTTLGPGATNAYVGVAHAYLDRAPVLLITAQTNERLLPGHTHQVLDLQAVFEPVTKFTASITTENVYHTMQQALAMTMTGRPGPVHLSVSGDTAKQVVSPKEQPIKTTQKSDAAPSDISAAREAFANAKRPVIVTGVGLEPEQPYEALRIFAEAAQAPVISTPKGKGSLADNHPLATGTLGLTRTDPVYEVLDEADCIIAVGFDVVELVKPWDQSAPLIWVAPWENEDANLPAVAEFVGPMTPVLEQFSDLIFDSDTDWGEARVSQFRQKLAQAPLPSPTKGTMLPQAVLRAIRDQVPPDTLITTDVGSHKICTALSWPTDVPNRYMVSNGLSAMSFGVTGAIAAAFILDQPTVCITGDAGLGMVMGELSLITELDLPVIIVVMNDEAIDLIRSAQVRAGKPVFGTEFINPKFGLIAEAFGLEFHQVATEAACNTAITTAMASARPTLIEALIDPRGYPTHPK
ncbi:MAG: thiamine pyrophosphate-binding protein [Chloroflexota bacterium]